MNIKRIPLITGIVVVIVLICCILLTKLVFREWTNSIISISEEIRKSDLGDEFLFKYEDRDFPDSERSVDIFDSRGKERIAGYVLDDKSLKPDIITILDLPKTRCYEIYGQLIFRVDSENFKGVDIDRIPVSSLEALPQFVDVAKALVAKKEWKWIINCGEFLLKSGDNNIREILERYTLGHFTEEEFRVNKGSEITKEEMISFAKRIINQK